MAKKKSPRKKKQAGPKATKATTKVANKKKSKQQKATTKKKSPTKRTSRTGKKPQQAKKPTPAKSAPKSGSKRSSKEAAVNPFIVGIGASAGGLESLRLFFKATPLDTGMAFIVVAHLAQGQASLLPELIQACTQLPVKQITEAMPVLSNHVYVIPPSKFLKINERVLHLLPTGKKRGRRLPIDLFFCDLADDVGPKAIGVILSGTGSDGSLGLRAIKSGAGLAVAQDEESAAFDGMPAAAVETGVVDFVSHPELMAKILVEYVARTSHTKTEQRDSDGPVAEALHQIYAILRARINHDFSLYKKNTICRRIERRMEVRQLDHISKYVQYLQESQEEAGILFKELLIGVSNFFRDPGAFDYLGTQVLPSLLENKPEDATVRVWVAGCSTGEEAYSIAILLHECMEQTGRHFRIQLFGTDVDEAAIDIARGGLYPASIAEDVGTKRLKRYFREEENGHFRVRRMIRESLVFATQNLIKDPPFTKLDLLCCRNLLIYLGRELQQALFPIFHYSLNEDGILFLGSSETIGHSDEFFKIEHKKWKLFRRRANQSAPLTSITLPMARRAGTDIGESQIVLQDASQFSDLELVESILHQSKTPPCVAVDDAFHIVYIHGKTGDYLEPAEGRGSSNILEMARPGLRKQLSNALRQVATSKQEITCKAIPLPRNGEEVYLNLTVSPILGCAPPRGLLLVTFEETVGPKRIAKRLSERTQRKARTVAHLESELLVSQDTLQTAIEELETSNEELKSANEELQSTNEELQSTNEELETSKEELQSLNEESSTVNAELQARIDELTLNNDDMKNLLDSTHIATVFVDSKYLVRRYTPKATDIIPLTLSDIGRPIQQLATTLIDFDIAEVSQRVMRDLIFRESTVASKDNKTYMIRVRPYRTVRNVIDGTVITFEDITERTRDKTEHDRLANNIKTERDKLRILIDNMDAEAWLCDATGQITAGNQAAVDGLGFNTFEEIHQPLQTLLGSMEFQTADGNVRSADDAPMTRALQGESSRSVAEQARHLKTGQLLQRRVSAAPVKDAAENIVGAVAVVHDVTAELQSKRTLFELGETYRSLFELVRDAIIAVRLDDGSHEVIAFTSQAHIDLGYTREEFSQLTICDFQTELSPEETQEALQRALEDGGGTHRTTHRTKEGAIREVLVQTKAVSIQGQALVLFIVQGASGE